MQLASRRCREPRLSQLILPHFDTRSRDRKDGILFPRLPCLKFSAKVANWGRKWCQRSSQERGIDQPGPQRKKPLTPRHPGSPSTSLPSLAWLRCPSRRRGWAWGYGCAYEYFRTREGRGWTSHYRRLLLVRFRNPSSLLRLPSFLFAQTSRRPNGFALSAGGRRG